MILFASQLFGHEIHHKVINSFKPGDPFMGHRQTEEPQM